MDVFITMNKKILFSFEKLNVYILARELNLKIFRLSETFPKSSGFTLKQQLNRSSMSICANIAEGTGRKRGKDQAQFYKIAFSSLLETLNHLMIATDYEYLNIDILENEYKPMIHNIHIQLSALYKYSMNASDAIPK
jgi:four helix bundle protein